MGIGWWLDKLSTVTALIGWTWLWYRDGHKRGYRKGRADGLDQARTLIRKANKRERREVKAWEEGEEG